MIELRECNNLFLTNLLEKTYFEKKIIVLVGDFDTNLKHYDLHRDMSDFLDLMYLDTSLSQITTPSHINSKSVTLIDNILVNEYEPTFLSGSLTTSLSDHATQFLIMSSVKKKNELANNRPEIYRDMKSIYLNQDYISILLKTADWES